MQQTPDGVAGDSRDGGGSPSREVAVGGFATVPRMVPGAYYETRTQVSVYCAIGAESFIVTFGALSAGEWQICTTEAGLEAIIGACQSALIRARIERDNAPAASAEVPAEDIPF